VRPIEKPFYLAFARERVCAHAQTIQKYFVVGFDEIVSPIAVPSQTTAA
jgi:hypothetical protein